MRGIVVFLVVYSIICAATCALAEPPTFRMLALPELSGMESTARVAVRDSVRGIIIGGSSKTADGVEHGVLWEGHWNADTDCMMVDVPAVLPGPVPEGASKLNDLWRPTPADCTGMGTALSFGFGVWEGIDPDSLAKLAKPILLKKPILWLCDDARIPWCLWDILPTLPGGEGEGFGIDGPSGDAEPICCGVSRNAASIQKAVIWEKDVEGVWQVLVLPHPTMGSEGAALDVVGPDESTTVVVGFAENESGQKRPQVWKRVGAGPWVRTELPVPNGFATGAGLAIVWQPDPRLHAAGWSADGSGNRVALRWEEVLPSQWTVTALGSLPGRVESEALGVYYADTKDWFTGTSYNATPLSDGLATLWEVNGASTNVYDLNSLVVGQAPLEAFDAREGIVWDAGDILLVGTGRSLGAAGGKSTSTTNQHALLLIEDASVSVSPPAAGLPISLSATPNPFERATSVSFSLLRPDHALLSVYDVQGRRVATVADGYFSAGRHDAYWPAQDAGGNLIGPGVYLLRLETGGAVTTRKVLQIR